MTLERKSIQKFSEEVGAGPMSVRLIFRNIRDWILETIDRRVEIQGVGIFYKKEQQERWSRNGKTYFNVPSRSTLGFRAPARRRDISFEVDQSWRVDFKFFDFSDGGSDAQVAWRNGAISHVNGGELPHGGDRGWTFHPNPDEPDWIIFSYSLETGTVSPQGDWHTTRKDVWIRRIGSGWEFEFENDPGFQKMEFWFHSHKSLWQGDVHEVNYQVGNAHDLDSKHKSFLASAFFVANTNVDPV